MPVGEQYKLVNPSALPDPETSELPNGVFKTVKDAVKSGPGVPIVLLPGVYEEVLLIEVSRERINRVGVGRRNRCASL